jgi:hypothetical protein
MIRRALLAVAVFFALATGPGALAQSGEAPSGDGGLHVSGGGTVGYVGGSGSISGTVRGPAGGRGRPSGPAVAPAPAPNASKDGVVAPARQAKVAKEVKTDAAPVSDTMSMVPFAVVVAASIIAMALFIRRRPVFPAV